MSETKLTFTIGGDLNVNRIGYGGMQLTGPGVWGDAPDRENAKKVIKTAVSSGVNFIDTADAYGPHTNEVLFAEALGNDYNGITVATKEALCAQALASGGPTVTPNI